MILRYKNSRLTLMLILTCVSHYLLLSFCYFTHSSVLMDMWYMESL